ncbi:inactive Ufm1-specific protease 1 [Pangasianodon hypophthalmus]|uniref:inactive Ufm1-specific protease 1 n=1 Tax=Pangasianodon hypophthalmus TaxID=310915 RepID=UPI000EFE093F|nr:inactive Ufm1-specific protease 1 [Pangasianodon hypophthalmus]
MERTREEDIDWGERVHREDPLTTVNKRVKDVLVKNAHEGLALPLTDYERCSVISGQCVYYHYGCDGQDDRGWGCGYRTVQTIGSWINNVPHGGKSRPPPSLPEIQQALVTVGDKPASFLGSKEWIGTYEAALVLDQLYDVPCRLVHVRSGGTELKRAAQDLHQHFITRGSPVMMGGDRDNSSKGILGVCTGKEGSYLLIMDPHYYGPVPEREFLQKNGWVAWRRVESLDQSSFYNLCLPQT